MSRLRLDMTGQSVNKALCLAIVIFASVQARAQFTRGLLANESYWSDGKAEFDFYDAQLMRAGELRHCEALHIFIRERVDPKTFARIDDPKRAEAISSVRMHQIWSAPIGIFVEQGSITAHWNLESFSLARLNFIGTDSFGNVTKRLEENEKGWTLVGSNYREGESSVTLSPPPNAIFQEELPLRVRTIDFTKPSAEFEIQLASSIAGFMPTERIVFAPAKVSWKSAEKNVEVLVRRANGTDRFVLDRDFPFLLREWTAADGSKLKLKRSLKADYWNYSKNGDRERALNNPMLQHPD